MIRNDTDATQPSRRRGGALLVRVVKGAPGDGNQTLTEAMKISIRDAGFNVTDDPRQAGFVLTGVVTVTPVTGNLQRVRIV